MVKRLMDQRLINLETVMEQPLWKEELQTLAASHLARGKELQSNEGDYLNALS